MSASHISDRVRVDGKLYRHEPIQEHAKRIHVGLHACLCAFEQLGRHVERRSGQRLDAKIVARRIDARTQIHQHEHPVAGHRALDRSLDAHGVGPDRTVVHPARLLDAHLLAAHLARELDYAARQLSAV